MNQPMGQVAYEACQQYLASNAPHLYEQTMGPDVDLSWDGLPHPYREAWEAGAQAVLAEYASQHKAPGRADG